MALTVERRTEGAGVEVFRLAGPMTLGRESQSLEWTITEAVKAGQIRIVMDMTEVTYIDSASVGIVMGCYGKIADAKGHFRVAGAPEKVRQVFHLTRVDALLSLDATLGDALAAIAG